MLNTKALEVSTQEVILVLLDIFAVGDPLILTKKGAELVLGSDGITDVGLIVILIFLVSLCRIISNICF